MPHLFGTDYPVEQLRQMITGMRQIAGVRLLELADGKPRGMRVAEVYTGSGFRFQVLIDRALDIGAAEYAGKSVAWTHPALGSLAHYEPTSYGWGRTWGGGLMTTAGLVHFGQPETDAGEVFGLHGRIGHLPAENVGVTEGWQGDDYVLEIAGEVRQIVIGGENLLLQRKISTRLGATSLTIEDTVRNDAFRTTSHMILYHCNFGFPVVSPESELLVADEFVNPRDAEARGGLDRHTRFEAPVQDYPEQVFFHKPRVDADGNVQAALVNRALEFGGYVRYRAAELPFLAQWKQMSAGSYVCALEPANHWEAPRARLREEGRMKYLEPGEEVHYRVELGALPDGAAVQQFAGQLAQVTGQGS